MTSNQTHSSRLSHTDLSSPDSINATFNGEEKHDTLSEQAEDLNMTSGDQATDLNLTSANHVARLNATSGDRGTDLHLTGGSPVTTGLNTTGSDQAQAGVLNMRSGDEGTGLHVTCQGVDMTKEPQAFDAARPTPNVGSDATDRQDAVYGQDCDAPEAMSLSLSADDE